MGLLRIIEQLETIEDFVKVSDADGKVGRFEAVEIIRLLTKAKEDLRFT